MGAYPVPPSFPINLTARPNGGILVRKRGAGLELLLDPAGPGGGGSTAPAATTLAAHRAIRSGPTGVSHYSAVDASQFASYVGISLAAAMPGDVVKYQQAGSVDETSWNWIAGLPVYAAEDGELTQAEPVTGVSQVVGVAIAATTILLGRYTPILL